MDMDGVLVREQTVVPGADRFVGRLRELERPFLVLTNNSMYTPRDLAARLMAIGLEVPEDRIWTSALATARFLAEPAPGGHGVRRRRDRVDDRPPRGRLHAHRPEPGLRRARRDTDVQLRAHLAAIRLIAAGARFIATNPDPIGPTPEGPLPADRLRRCPDQPRDRRRAVLRRQAEPADDARGAERDRRALRDDRDGRRPDGHRHRRRASRRACTRSSC